MCPDARAAGSCMARLVSPRDGVAVGAFRSHATRQRVRSRLNLLKREPREADDETVRHTCDVTRPETTIQTTHLCDGPQSGVLPILRLSIEYPLGGLSLPALSSLPCWHVLFGAHTVVLIGDRRVASASRCARALINVPSPPHTGAHLRAFLAGGAAASGGGPVGYGVIWPAMAIMRASTDWTSAYPWLETGLRPSLASIDESAML